VSRLRRDQRGVTLIELLVGMTLTTIVLGATLTVFEGFVRADRRTGKQNDAQDRVRTATDRLARELRNVASPTEGLPEALDKAEPYDLVFKTADPVRESGSLNAWNTRRIRYCLDSSQPDDGRLWMQVQRWTTATAPPVPSTASCPSAVWPTQVIVADNIVNRSGGRDRPVFYYSGGPSLTDITGIRTDLFIDVEPAQRPAESRLSSGVFLRNQNRAPNAGFSVTLKQRTLVLNGSASRDPEGANLTYEWSVDGEPAGSDIVVSYDVPGSGPRDVNVSLTVSDPAGLKATFGPQVVRVP
jgi:prepilin-type N-terminal cleavage/methylation domain-containing protein